MTYEYQILYTDCAANEWHESAPIEWLIDAWAYTFIAPGDTDIITADPCYMGASAGWEWDRQYNNISNGIDTIYLGM